MLILDVSPRPSYPLLRGADVRIYNLLRNLSRRNEVRQFCQVRWRGFRGRPWVEERLLGPGYQSYHYFHPVACAVGEIPQRSWVTAPVLSGAGLSLTRPRLLAELLEWAEVVLVEYPWQFDYCHERKPRGKLVLASHNLEADKFSDYARADGVAAVGGHWLRRIERMERKAVEQADVVLAVSREERWGFIERYGADPGRVIEVPNGADTALCVPARSDEKEDAKQKLGLPSKPAILFVGNDNPPNRAGLRWVGRLAAQAPQFAFVVVGEVGQGPRVDGNLITTGYVEDYRPYLRAADIGFCPIQYGAGTKIKMMEYLEAGLPTVAFVESLRGTEFRDGEHLLVAKAEEGAIMEAFQRLVRNPDISANLSVAAREYMVEHHDWSRIAASLETALVTAP